MDSSFGRLVTRAATIDELLSDDFETLPGQKGDAELAAKRLASWCKSCANGDWLLFSRRLQRDNLAIDQVLARFATARRRASAPTPEWFSDAIWIEMALRATHRDLAEHNARGEMDRHAFDDLFVPLTEEAEARLWSSMEASASDSVSASARACLRGMLLKDLCQLCAPALYERFAEARQAADAAPGVAGHTRHGTAQYERFIREMQTGGFRRLFDEKPVLLRLIATITRQWLCTSVEFITRLNADLEFVRRDIMSATAGGRVVRIEGPLSDRHRGGRSVLAIEFDDGLRAMYKPKDLRLDVAWHALVEELNETRSPVKLRTVCAIARDGYGWSEYIEHSGCVDVQDFGCFFRRAGAWLALFHCFAGTDLHHENIVAAGDQPVPIDLETILQAAVADQGIEKREGQAGEVAREIVANSVTAVGLLPAYGTSPENEIFVVGGVASDWSSRMQRTWKDINSDTMRPIIAERAGSVTPNLPHIDGRYARLGDHIDEFISGFEEYAKFLVLRSGCRKEPGLFDRFAKLAVRKVIRSTRFYSMVLHRLRDDRTMHDGVVWSAQADFLARLANWEDEWDPVWPLQRAERLALLELNVPLFVMQGDGSEIDDMAGVSAPVKATSGLERARTRVQHLDDREITWQVEFIRQAIGSAPKSDVVASAGRDRYLLRSSSAVASPAPKTFLTAADAAALQVSRSAIRRGSSAAWIGLAGVGNSEVFQLRVLGPDLYNGACGIAVFLAAHALVSCHGQSAELALTAVSHVRNELKNPGAARLARQLGVGGATGLGSVVYALTVMSKLLCDNSLLADAHVAAELFSEDLIAADSQLDVISGSAGAILCLLRLYRDTQAKDVLETALKCGEHLLAGLRSVSTKRRDPGWPEPNHTAVPGFSHGEAGFAYALASLAKATGHDEFAKMAAQCIARENQTYTAAAAGSAGAHEGEQERRSQWCHRAAGMGLARLAIAKLLPDSSDMATDIRDALARAIGGWPANVDTLCCGSLGNVELFREAGKFMQRDDLRELGSRRLLAVVENAAFSGEYRWNAGDGRFNLGLFRGLAGVGYTCLREVTDSLPNILIWE